MLQTTSYKFILFIALTFIVSACQTIQPLASAPLYQYRADIQITVDGVTFDGFGVTLLGEKDIQIVSKAPLNVLKITSCSRDFVTQDVDKDWFGGVGHSFTYHYVPNKYEADGICPLYIQAIGANGTAAWGYIVFRTDQKLKAQYDCNGIHWTFAGISACQTKSGLRQEIFFAGDVQHTESENCDISLDLKNPHSYIVATKNNGFCYATFTDGKDWHQMVLLGYDQVLVRSGS